MQNHTLENWPGVVVAAAKVIIWSDAVPRGAFSSHTQDICTEYTENISNNLINIIIIFFVSETARGDGGDVLRNVKRSSQLKLQENSDNNLVIHVTSSRDIVTVTIDGTQVAPSIVYIQFKGQKYRTCF